MGLTNGNTEWLLRCSHVLNRRIATYIQPAGEFRACAKNVKIGNNAYQTLTGIVVFIRNQSYCLAKHEEVRGFRGPPKLFSIACIGHVRRDGPESLTTKHLYRTGECGSGRDTRRLVCSALADLLKAGSGSREAGKGAN
ncbi:hypothetical protein DACRYDRAFT_22526, partial [Dacryopinax primogenitus]